MKALRKIAAFSIIALAIFTIIVFLHPQQPLAADAKTADFTVFNPGTYECKMLPGQLVEALIDCIRTPVKAVVLKPDNGTENIGLLAFISKYMAKFLILVTILAIVIFGLKVFNVRNNPYTVGVGLLIKIGIAFILLNNLGGFATKLFDVFDELVNLGNNGGVSIWKQIDLFMSELFGFVTDSPGDIEKGIITLLNGSIFSKNIGIMLSIVGVFAIGSVIMFILQSMYLYLSSFIGFAFLLAISPIFILFFVFNYTERFFSKWFELVIATILTPMLMFAFLGIFLDTASPDSATPTPGIIRQAVDRVFEALGNGDKAEGHNYVKRCLTPAQPLVGSYLLPTDSNMIDKLACPPPLLVCDERDKNNSSVQTWLNPYLFKSFNYMPFTVVTLDCGEKDQDIKRNVYLALLTLFLYVAFINSMLHKIPDIATDLANGVSVGVSHISTPVMGILKSLK